MPKCKNCKNKFTPRFRTTEKYCWEVECKTIEAMLLLKKKKAKDLRDRNKEKAEKKKELMTLSDWIKIAQAAFNAYIRKRDNGNVCISCQKPAKKENAGHFFNANNHYMVRFDEQSKLKKDE